MPRASAPAIQEGLTTCSRPTGSSTARANARASVSANNLAEGLLSLGRLEEARTFYTEGNAWARRGGDAPAERYGLAGLAAVAYHFGEANEAASLLDDAGMSGSDEFTTAWIQNRRGRLVLREDPERAVEHAEEALEYADKIQNDEIRVDAYALLARAHQTAGRQDSARVACDAFLERWQSVPAFTVTVVEAGLVLAAQGRHAELAAASALALPSPWADAARALSDSRYDEAAAILDGIPSIPLRDAVGELIRVQQTTDT